jgi:hypothetical protein
MAEVWELDLLPNLKLVLLALADHADDTGGSVYPSVSRIAWKCGCSERTAQRRLRDLIDLGLIETVAYPNGGRGRATEYRLTLGKGVKLAPFLASGDLSERVTDQAERVTDQAERVTDQARKGATPVTPTISNHQITIKNQERADRIGIKDALIEVMGWEVGEITQSGWGRIERAAKELHTIGATPSEIRRRARIYLINNPGKLTPTALAANWQDCAEPRVRPSSRQIEQAARRDRMLGAT